MTISFCPHCNQRIVTSFDSNDFIHQCNSGNDVLDQEDVVVTGDWEDFSGSGTKGSQEVLRQGAENEFFGQRAQIAGADKSDDTDRGARVSTHRQRQHFEFINMKREGLD